jgi:hypothetical protein
MELMMNRSKRVKQSQQNCAEGNTRDLSLIVEKSNQLVADIHKNEERNYGSSK